MGILYFSIMGYSKQTWSILKNDIMHKISSCSALSNPTCNVFFSQWSACIRTRNHDHNGLLCFFVSSEKYRADLDAALNRSLKPRYVSLFSSKTLLRMVLFWVTESGICRYANDVSGCCPITILLVDGEKKAELPFHSGE
ncbi:unnamed protein product [Larinioides sclopetarius]|uniref:Uncharacterized protein n=1 Tax=Larinioides sclopetarius TaxID=280406 RepID=A0AAV2A3N2_9ARAC